MGFVHLVPLFSVRRQASVVVAAEDGPRVPAGVDAGKLGQAQCRKTAQAQGRVRSLKGGQMSKLFERHRDCLTLALKAISERGYWSPYPENPSPKVYGEDAKAQAEAAFKSQLGQPFDLDQPSSLGRVGAERSPYGFDLGITYPKASIEDLVAAAGAAADNWSQATIEDWVGVCLESLARLNRKSFEIANAVMHTTGQSWPMAFQAGGPNAQDRGLEAVAYAYGEMTRIPGHVLWQKPQGKADPIRLEKAFRVVPRGIALVIGCSTFPTWNGYPGLFASLATGNAVIVKPHPGAILPLALSVRIIRQVLAEEGFDPNAVQLAADSPQAPITKELVRQKAIGIIDFTGSPAFGDWVKANAQGAQVYTEQAGVNSVVIDGIDNFQGMCANLAFSLSLYSGQMCTAPQNIYVPRGGVATNEGKKSLDQVGRGIAQAIESLLGAPERAATILGAIQNEATLRRVAEAKA
jgi:phenylacetic acid degradation protein paaN